MPKSADRRCTGLILDLRHATPRSTLEQQDLHRLHLDSQARRRRLVAHARVDEPGTALSVHGSIAVQQLHLPQQLQPQRSTYT